MDVGRDDMLQNIVTTEDLHMNGNIPWCDRREKSFVFLEMLVMATTQPRDIVMDCTGSTSASIIACHNINLHVVALESDIQMYKVVIALLIKVSAATSKVQEDSTVNLDDIDGAEIVPDKIVKRSCFAL
ncbi:hypothetical protein M758_UG127300 [Ceratodon purpureus]|nr:hypothetical protein M758_UG127300 [Ceratodon purpureus]